MSIQNRAYSYLIQIMLNDYNKGGHIFGKFIVTDHALFYAD